MRSLREDSQIDFFPRNVLDVSMRSPPPPAYRETSVPKIPKKAVFLNWVERIGLSRDMVSIFRDPRRATRSTRIANRLIRFFLDSVTSSEDMSSLSQQQIINCEKSIFLGVRETSQGPSPPPPNAQGTFLGKKSICESSLWMSFKLRTFNNSHVSQLYSLSVVHNSTP